MVQYYTIDLLNNHYGVIADGTEPGIDFKIVLLSPDAKHVKSIAKKLNDTEEIRTLGTHKEPIAAK